MTNEEKIQKVNHDVERLKSIADRALKRKNYNEVMSAVNACANILYHFNQTYTDSDLENYLLEVSKKLVGSNACFEGEKDRNTVLFYDRIAFDMRGWAISFIKAFISAGYHLIYVVPLYAKGKLPNIEKELSKGNCEVYYLNTYDTHVKNVNNLVGIFNRTKPCAAFFHTNPWDASGTVAFNAFKGKTNRFQVDLTDHAFWLGRNAVDYCLEVREMGASLCLYERGFDRSQILRYDVPPYISHEKCEEPFPFDVEEERYFFSGGLLYKTLGDDNLLFYAMADELLSQNEGLKFIYAGTGDDSEMKKLCSRYPDRAYLIGERPDFFRLFKNCTFYLNTYPMFGGQMMRYAAIAGKLPLTLKHEHDADGILNNQSELGIEFDTQSDLVEDAKRLLTDREYLKSKEDRLKKATMSEKGFSKTLRTIVESCSTGMKFDEISRIDTTDFRKEYIERYNYYSDLDYAVFEKSNFSLCKYYPMSFIRKVIKR